MMRSYKSIWRKLKEEGQEHIPAICNLLNILYLGEKSIDPECDPETPSPSKSSSLYSKPAIKKWETDQPLRKQLSHNESGQDLSSEIFTIKSMKTFSISKKIDLIDLFSKDVISERVRKDPRESENHDSIFKIIQEWESDDEGETKLKIEEEVSASKLIEQYNSNKNIIGSGIEDNKSESEEKQTIISYLKNTPKVKQ